MFLVSMVTMFSAGVALAQQPAPVKVEQGLLQGITARVAGSVDEYLDWAVPSYAKLYSHSHDRHCLDVARVLLHDTKSMVALPG